MFIVGTVLNPRYRVNPTRSNCFLFIFLINRMNIITKTNPSIVPTQNVFSPKESKNLLISGRKLDFNGTISLIYVIKS